MILGARWKPIEAQWPRLDAIAYAHDVKLEALRLLGAMLKATTRATGGDAQRTRFQKGRESPLTIKELGLDYKTSMLARLLGTMLKETKRARPAVGSKIIGSERVPMKDDRPTLADLGLDKKTSMLAQRVANLSPVDLWP